MAKKEENILDYLAKGTRENIAGKDGWNKEVECVKVSVGNCEYTYPKYYTDKYDVQHDFSPELKKKWDAESRRESHYYKYGCNLSHPSRINDEIFGEKEFGESLKYLSEHRQIAAEYYAAYKEACKVSAEIQKYVFVNLIEQLRKDKLFQTPKDFPNIISFDIIERLPKAFQKDWEKVDLGGWNAHGIAEDLTPASGYEIGKECYIQLSRFDRERTKGTIVGYSYTKGKHGLYLIMYDVVTNPWSGRGVPYRLEEIKFTRFVA